MRDKSLPLMFLLAVKMRCPRRSLYERSSGREREGWNIRCFQCESVIAVSGQGLWQVRNNETPYPKNTP